MYHIYSNVTCIFSPKIEVGSHLSRYNRILCRDKGTLYRVYSHISWCVVQVGSRLQEIKKKQKTKKVWMSYRLTNGSSELHSTKAISMEHRISKQRWHSPVAMAAAQWNTRYRSSKQSFFECDLGIKPSVFSYHSSCLLFLHPVLPRYVFL